MLTNDKVKSYPLLKEMYDISYFPDVCVDKVRDVILAFCGEIEANRPADLPALYALADAYMEQVNQLQAFFWEHDSDIETAARDSICDAFLDVVEMYDFVDIEVERVIGARDF